MKKKIIAMLAAMMCLASSSLSYSSVAIAANSLNSNDIAEVKITSSDLKECNLVTESKNDGCWINFDLVSGAFAMSGNNHQSFSIIGSFERKDNDLYLYPENGSAEFYILHREEDHFVSQSDEIGVQLKAGLVFYADNDAFWEILLDWTLSGNEPSNTGETAEQNTSFIMGDVNDDDTFEDAECAMTVTVSEINGETLLVKSSDGKGELLTLSTKYLDSSIQPKVGMKLEVVYTGGILLTYPCQFGNVKKVSVVSDNTTLMGDVNADGEFGIADVILLQKWMLAVPDTHLANWRAANFCDDDRLDVFDLTLMKRALVEKMNEIPEDIAPPEPSTYGFYSYDKYAKYVAENNLQDKIVTYEQISQFGDFVQCFINCDWEYNHYFSLVYVLDDGSGKTFDLVIKALNCDKTLVNTDFDRNAQDNHELVSLTQEEMNLTNLRTVETNAEYAYFEFDDKQYNYYNGRLSQIVWYDNEHEYMLIGNPQLSDYPDVDNTYLAKLLKVSAVNPCTPPTQPINYQNFDSLVKALNSNDLTSYPEEDRETYHQMFERFQNDGFIYQVTDNDLIKTNQERGITLFPSASYEDVGIGCYVTFKGNNYHIMFYSANADVLAETDGIAAYLKKRMGRSSDKEITVSDKTVSLLFHENGQCYANAFVDENHYFDVIGAVSEEEMTEFLNAFAYEKIVF